MILAAVLAFGLNFILYKNWHINDVSWFMLAIKTLSIFALSMLTYTVFAALLKIEFVGELLERIKNYIRRKFIRE